MFTTVAMEFCRKDGTRETVPVGEPVELIHPDKAGAEISNSAKQYQKHGRHVKVIMLRGQPRIVDSHMVRH